MEVLIGNVITGFEAQVRRAPEQVALLFEDQTLSYAELNSRANQLAHALQARGVGPDVLVGVCIERSLEMVVALLAVLKAGGASVPLDPAYPRERLASMLQDAQVPVLLTEQSTVSRLPQTSANIITLESYPCEERTACQENPTNAIQPEQLAYLIYTSGSTGQPKGVMMPHRALTNLIDWQLRAVSADCRILHYAPISFDVSFQEIATALCSGGTLILCREEIRTDFVALWKLILNEHITHLFLPPVALSEMAKVAEHLDLSSCSLQSVLCAGEQLILNGMIRDLCRRIPCTLGNQYGPSETHVVMALTLSGDPGAWPIRVPVGTPIPHVEVCILDQEMHTVPPGSAGELYLGGVCLAHGYRNRPDLTADRFISLHINGYSSSRWYKTGDQARWNEDGQIEFLGRADRQVKVRGYRVELGEIEARLHQHPSVHAAVVALSQTRGEAQLIATVVGEPGESLTFDVLSSYLRASLPDFMIPSAFYVVPLAPKTPSGKLNREALAGMAERKRLLPEEISQERWPETEIEQTAQAICTDVLGCSLEDLGWTRTFGGLGMSSLQEVALASRLAAALELDVQVTQRLVRRFPTLGELSIALQAASAVRDQHWSVLPRDTHSLPAHIQTEKDSLFDLITQGQIAPVETVALAYLPQVRDHQRALIQAWNKGKPVLTHIISSPLGRIGIIALPVERQNLYSEWETVVTATVQALEMAKEAGARMATLTGLLSSALNYGMRLVPLLSQRRDLPAITTGHATTTAAMVMTIEQLAALAGRDLPTENVAVIGLGSIGRATLQLLLTFPHLHPRKLLLCDLSRERLLAREQEIRACGYKGILISTPAERGVIPDLIYEQASYILGASNGGSVLSLERLRTGTIIVDDSAPHCFDPQKALVRMHPMCQDWVFAVEGGALHVPAALGEVRYLPFAHIDEVMHTEEMTGLRDGSATEIWGCLLSAAISVRWNVPPTIGTPDVRVCREQYEALRSHGYSAARPHLEDTPLGEELLQTFSKRHQEGRQVGGRS